MPAEETKRQQPMPEPGGVPRPGPPRAAYIHVPFCAHRCGYCNFTLVAGRKDLIPAYLTALRRELEHVGGVHPVQTLFFGGGTPTQLAPAEFAELLEIVQATFPLEPGGEFSVEANPADLTPDRAAALAAGGVTRISLGVQSFDPQLLRLLERDHSPEQIATALELARGFAGSVSLDLIFANPGQTMGGWERDLEAALALAPDHISTYGLTYERGTAFWTRLAKEQLTETDEETQREMYLRGIDVLAAAGLEHYEVSNHARPGHACRHNEVYWEGAEYFAAGPGAARYVNGERSVNHRSTFTWIRRLQAGESPIADRERLAPEDRARELLVLGLRRIRGIDEGNFETRTGFSARRLLANSLRKWLDLGLVEIADARIRLTRAGLLVSDQMWGEVVRA